MSRTRLVRGVAAVSALLLVSVEVVRTADASDPLGGRGASTLAREPQLTPEEIGNGSVDGLQFPDPTEGLALVAPPAVSSDGGAHLDYPLLIPKGRGITPELALSYDSGGGDGWMGQGWDLSVGDISVDTEFGAPYFDPDYESETYAIDGEMLIPNALGDTWEPRLHGDRQDYTRQVETEYQQIIRHEVPGMGTKGYFWEVHDKGGNVFWYGGMPDQGGPDGYNYVDDDLTTSLTPTIDDNAIVKDDNDNGVQWLLSAQRDVGVNQISYHYETVYYVFGADGWTPVTSCEPSTTILCGRHTYLSSIDYTEAADVAPAPDGDAQYQIRFVRDSDPTLIPDPGVRQDPIVDGMGGYVDVTLDRLMRVDVYYGGYTLGTPVPPDPEEFDPEAEDFGDPVELLETRNPRTYNQLVVSYRLAYGDPGPFGKSLLRSVSQVGSDESTSASHEFTYYDSVTAGDAYDVFAESKNWSTGDDLPDRQLISPDNSIGALGSSESNSAEGHAYIGFNPAVPEKVGSFGGSLQIGGGATEAIAEWLDINGDGLPDKVYRDSNGNPNDQSDPAYNPNAGDTDDTNRDGPIRYRLNTSKPTDALDAEPTFGPEQTVTGIKRLSTEGNFGLEGAFQAFPGVEVAFGLGVEVSWGDAYFTDANADGLPDYVSGGTVWFNHLVNGVPTFVAGDSSDTPVPIDDTAAASVQLPTDVQKAKDRLMKANPLVDTVRRWTAPFAGTVTIDAPVTYVPGDVLVSNDGVRVAIEQDGANVVQPANLFGYGSRVFTDPITDIPVAAGSNIYFRVGSVNDGSNDDVEWSPTITYTEVDGIDLADVPLDVNGLSQVVYVAAEDFTLSGRPDTKVLMPYRGTVHFEAQIDKGVTTDDLTVQLLHNGVAVTLANGHLDTAAGTTTVSADIPVAAPTPPPNDTTPGTQDSLSLKLVTDTAIDLHAVTWNPSIHYTQAFDNDNKPIANPGNIKFDLTPEIEQYPHSSFVNSPVAIPWSASDAITRDAVFKVTLDAKSKAGTALVTVKDATGVVASDTVDVPAGNNLFATDVEIQADALDAQLAKDTNLLVRGHDSRPERDG